MKAKIVMLLMTFILSSADASANTWDPDAGRVTVDSVAVGNNIYIDVVVTFSDIVSYQTGPATRTFNSYDPASKQAILSSVRNIKDNQTYTDAVIAVKDLVSVGSIVATDMVSSYADSYDPDTGLVSIDTIEVAGNIYSKVVITLSDIISYRTDPATRTYNTYDPATKLATLSAVRDLNSNRLYTDAVVAVKDIVSVGSITSASGVTPSACPRPAEGSTVDDPPQSPSFGGMLSTSLNAYNVGQGPKDPINNYDYRFCLLEQNVLERSSPVLRVNPGDQVNLKLVDRLTNQDGFPTPHVHAMDSCIANQNLNSASIATMNLHYHGLNIPPVCGADDVLTTLLQPNDGTPGNVFSFDYAFRIPANEPPGLFWYHPHIHGTAQQHVLGGMTGVLVVEGMHNYFPELKDLRERILVLRDLDKPNPGDNPDAPADEPWKNASINSVPIIYGSDKTPSMRMSANERQFWRVANASADTHFVLQFQFNQAGTNDGWQAQTLELVARDGVPFISDQGKAQGEKLNVNQIVLPPGGRAEFIVTAPPAGVAARFYSADYNAYLSQQTAGCAPSFPNSACDNTDRNPARILANIVTASAQAQTNAVSATPLASRTSNVASTGRLRRFSRLTTTQPSAARTLFFSKDPGNDGDFFITVGGNTPKPFDMSGPPDIVVQGPTVEDWTIENRDNESHDFHIHQVHFRTMEINGVAANDNNQPVLLDTIQLPACLQWATGIDPQNDPYGLRFPPDSPLNDSSFTGKNCVTPYRVKLRMDFRDRNIVGTFLYHCHILEHEDGGMMAKIQLK